MAFVLAVASLAPTPARAAIVLHGSSMPGAQSLQQPGTAANTLWQYTLSLLHTAGPAWLPAAAVRGTGEPSHGVLVPGAVFTLDGFSGYVAGSCTGPSGWICSARLPGMDPALAWVADTMEPTPADGIVDLVWTYVSGPKLAGSPTGVALGLFTAASWLGGSGQLDWSALGGPRQPGSNASWTADGQVAGPRGEGVPEPASMALAGLALLLAVTAVRIARPRHRRSRRRRI